MTEEAIKRGLSPKHWIVNMFNKAAAELYLKNDWFERALGHLEQYVLFGFETIRQPQTVCDFVITRCKKLEVIEHFSSHPRIGNRRLISIYRNILNLQNGL